MNKLILKNGHVFSPADGLDGRYDILIVDGKISKISEKIDLDGVQIVNLDGYTVFPGFIDLHAHFREPGFEYKEDIESGSRAAVAGGFTTVLVMPNTDPPVDSAEMVDYVLRRAGEVGLINIRPVGAITRGRAGKELADLKLMKEAGAVAFSDDGDWVSNSSVMRRALEYEGPIITHAEDKTLSPGGIMNESSLSYELGIKGIPHQTEEIAVARDILLAELTGGRLHIAHVSSNGSLFFIEYARTRGLNVTAEVTPHHLLFNEEVMRSYDPAYKVNPPLRTEEDRRALIRALKTGLIDVIATDHAPHASFEKEFDLNQAPFGILGLETAFPSLYTQLVMKGELDLGTLVRALSTRPAEIFGFTGKGRIKEGYDADLCVWDLTGKWMVTRDALHSKSSNTPFLGSELTGKLKYTIVGGKVIEL